MYKIKCIYDTGDSFHTEEDVEYILEESFSTMEKAIENLNRINEHYKYYEAKNGRRWHWNKEENKKLDNIVKISKTKPWFVEKYEFCLKLLLDNGAEWQFSAPYCGYFEHLKSVEIIQDLPKIEFH